MPTDPKTIAEQGTKIYAAKYQSEYEEEYPGQYVAIDVRSEEAFVRLTPEEALLAAQAAKPEGMFYLLKVGSPGVFRVGYSASGGHRGDWIFGR